MLRKLRKFLTNSNDASSKEQDEWEQMMLEEAFAPNKDRHSTLSRNARTFAALNKNKHHTQPTTATKQPPVLKSSSARELRSTKASTIQREVLSKSPSPLRRR